MKFTTIIFSILLSTTIFSQSTSIKDSLWSVGGELNFNLQNVGLYNWSAGGQSSYSFSSKIIFFANYDDGTHKWTNELNTAYGILHQQNQKYDTKKTDDQLIFNSQYGKNLSKNWWIIAGMRFQTQYTIGYEYKNDSNDVEQRNFLSNFMSPGYLTPSVGIEYSIKDKFRSYLSPVSARFIFVIDDSLSRIGAFGVNPGDNLKIYFGFNYSLWFKQQLAENITFENTFNLFGPYEKLGEMKVNWETQLIMSVNSWLNVNLGTNLIYDHDVILSRNDGTKGPGTQFKYALSLGLVFKLGDEK